MAKKTKKAIATIYSDLHLHLYNQFNPGDRRVKDALDVTKQVQLKSRILKVPTFFVGDLLSKEKGITNKLLDLILPPLSKIWKSDKYPTFAITGNHDQSEENTLEHTSPSYIKTFSKIFDGLFCVDNLSMNWDDLVIHGVPYLTHDLGLKKAIKNRIAKINSKKINILLLHTTLPGSQDNDGREMESNIKADILKLLKKFDVVFVGHIHKPMKLGKNIYQVGAPNHQRKTDRDQKLGYCILYSDLSVEYVHLDKYPKFVELEHGERIPDSKNFYYNKDKVLEEKTATKNNFSDTNNHSKLAKSYLKEKGIKDKTKRKALIKALNIDD